MTYVNYAELIWRKLETATQQAVADDLGWDRSLVARYSQLARIDDAAWVLVVTSVTNTVTRAESGHDDNGGKAVTFTEGLLRDIIPLTPEQQLDLVEALAASPSGPVTRFLGSIKSRRRMGCVNVSIITVHHARGWMRQLPERWRRYRAARHIQE